jgi:nucleoside-diphosphate-sugar epimerase
MRPVVQLPVLTSAQDFDYFSSPGSSDLNALQGNINLIEAAKKKGVKKFVLVTSIGTGDSKDAPPKQVYEVLKSVLLEKEKAEQRLKVILSP